MEIELTWLVLIIGQLQCNLSFQKCSIKRKRHDLGIVGRHLTPQFEHQNDTTIDVKMA